MQKRNVLLFFMLLWMAGPPSAHAQREVLYSQYWGNPLTINPAYTGVRGPLTMTAIFRRKFFGVQGMPITQSLGIDGATAGGRLGIGFQALNDRMSAYSNTGVYGSLAYHHTLANGAKLSIGGSGGINVLPVFDSGSRLAFNRALPSAGIGVHYEDNRFWAGISMPEIIRQPLVLGSGQTSLPYNRPLYVHAGAKLIVSDDLAVLPSVLLAQQRGFPLGADVNAKIWLWQKLGVGVSIRMKNSSYISIQDYFMALAEYQLSPTIRVGYTYSSRTVENPFLVQQSVSELTFRYTPSPGDFSYR